MADGDDGDDDDGDADGDSDNYDDQSMNPLPQMAAGVPKARTICSKWQLERSNHEPFAQHGSNTNRLLKVAAGVLKVRTLYSK